jgi:hypothetical protein
VPEWASLRRQLLSCLPRLSELRDHQLLLLLFKAADMQRRDSRAEQAALYTQICMVRRAWHAGCMRYVCVCRRRGGGLGSLGRHIQGGLSCSA